MTRTVVVKSDAFSKRLTPAQKQFAEQTIPKIAAAADPRNYSDENGAVKLLHCNRAGEYSYKPHKNLRGTEDLEIRIIFKPGEAQFNIYVIRVAPRDEVYGR